MKKAKSLIITVAVVLALVICTAVIGACGTTNLENGSYAGTCTYSYVDNEETVHAGYKVSFEVQDNTLWNLAVSAVDADWVGAKEGEKYVQPAYASGAPWNAGKALAQFENWTIAEFMQIKVKVDATDRPDGKDCISVGKEVTVGVGCEEGLACIILAVQNGIKTANKV